MKNNQLLAFFMLRLISKKKVLEIVNLFFLFVLFSSFQLNTNIAIKENAVIELSSQQLSIKKLISEIENQTDYLVVYSNQEVDVTRIVKNSKRTGMIAELLNVAFRNTEIKYEFDNNYIILSSKNNKSSEGANQRGPKNITGVVLDEHNEPLIGAVVVVKGSAVGAATNLDGRFELKAPEGALLTVSSIGYTSANITVGNQADYKIILKEETQQLGEVVVVGYGVQKKKDITGSITTVNSKMIAEAATSTVDQALRGQVAGLNVMQTSGKTGSNFKFQIRGETSILNSGVEPLVVIDGILSSTDYLAMLNPNDIEQIDVLKDVSATAIYGSKGAAGVIIVTTKGGTEGKNIIIYDGSFGIRKARHIPDMMNGQEFAQFVRDASDASIWGGTNTSWTLTPTEEADLELGKSVDWLDLLVDDGFQTSHNISLAGGGEKETHYMSLGYTKEEGNVKPDSFERFSLTAKVTGKIGKFVEVGASITSAIRKQEQQSGEILRGAFRLRPTGRAYDDEGEMQFWPTTNDSQIPSVLFEKENSAQHTETFNSFGKVFIEIQPIKGLRLKSNMMPDFQQGQTGKFTGKMTKANLGKNPASASLKDVRRFGYTWDNSINYQTKFNKIHSLNLLGLMSVASEERTAHFSEAKGLAFEEGKWDNLGASDQLTTITSDKEGEKLLSYMARVNYSLKDRYLLTVTGRWDGSSKLAKGHQWAFFPSAALAWRVNEEEFMKKFKQISNLKLRFSYGEAGNNTVAAFQSQSLLGKVEYDWNGSPIAGYEPSILPSKQLTWERSKEFNYGIDLGLFDNRLSLSFEYYNKKTKDLILRRLIPSHQGFESFVDNVGSVSNKGFEITLNSVNIQMKDFSWTTNINFSRNRNKILKLYGDGEDDIANRWFIGHSVKTNYDYRFLGIYQQSDKIDIAGFKWGMPKIEDIADANGVKDGVITEAGDKVILGTSDPKWLGGMTNTFQYKNIDFSVFIYTRQGEQKLSNFHTTHASDFNARYNILNVPYYMPERPSNRWWAPGSRGGSAVYKNASHYYDTSFVRVGNISLGYNVGKNILNYAKITRARVYATVLNPFLFTKYDGIDPEWAEANVTNNGMSNTTILFGLNITL